MRVSVATFARLTKARSEGLLGQIWDQREAYGERSDCSVIAMSCAFGIPYNVAHDILKDAGRVDKRGFGFCAWLRQTVAALDHICGYKVTPVRVPRLTLSQVRRDFPKGRFVIRKSGHAFAMIDGKILDPEASGPRAIVTDIFLLERV